MQIKWFKFSSLVLITIVPLFVSLLLMPQTEDQSFIYNLKHSEKIFGELIECNTDLLFCSVMFSELSCSNPSMVLDNFQSFNIGNLTIFNKIYIKRFTSFGYISISLNESVGSGCLEGQTEFWKPVIRTNFPNEFVNKSVDNSKYLRVVVDRDSCLAWRDTQLLGNAPSDCLVLKVESYLDKFSRLSVFPGIISILASLICELIFTIIVK